MRIHSLDDSPNHQFQKVPRTPNNNRNINLVDIDSYVGRINLMQAYQPPSIPPNATADIRKSILDQSVNLGYPKLNYRIPLVDDTVFFRVRIFTHFFYAAGAVLDSV